MSLDASKQSPSGTGTKKENPADRRQEGRRVVHEKCKVILSIADNGASGTAPISGVVTDISAKGIGIFSEAFLNNTTTIMIILKGRRFEHELQAKVAWCRRIPTTGRIIKASQALNWRMGLMFDFRSDEERALLEKLSVSL
ncbi:MAG: PilZ domain-containing protein [Bdellovibrionota bacterium]